MPDIKPTPPPNQPPGPPKAPEMSEADWAFAEYAMGAAVKHAIRIMEQPGRSWRQCLHDRGAARREEYARQRAEVE